MVYRFGDYCCYCVVLDRCVWLRNASIRHFPPIPTPLDIDGLASSGNDAVSKPPDNIHAIYIMPLLAQVAQKADVRHHANDSSLTKNLDTKVQMLSFFTKKTQTDEDMNDSSHHFFSQTKAKQIYIVKKSATLQYICSYLLIVTKHTPDLDMKLQLFHHPKTQNRNRHETTNFNQFFCPYQNINQV